tara:strand:+ start:1164 stop:1535 length:372 start_codon:yes stop_codon:yes gene_type:complete
MGGAVLQFLGQKHFTPDGIPREGSNVTNWGPPENRNREKYLEKYGAKSDDDRNFLKSSSTNAAPKKVEQKQALASESKKTLSTPERASGQKRIYGLSKTSGTSLLTSDKKQTDTTKKSKLGGK